MPFRLSAEFDASDPDLVAVIDDLALWSAPFGLKLLEVVQLRRLVRTRFRAARGWRSLGRRWS